MLCGISAFGASEANQRAVAGLQKLFNVRDVDSLLAASNDAVKNVPNVFRWLKTNGIYGGGTAGWTANLVTSPDGAHDYLVLGAVLGQEDIGAQVFEMKEGRLDRYVAESENFGWKIRHHDLTVEFTPATQTATIQDSFTFKKAGQSASTVILRLGQHYKISSLTRGGEKIPFTQGGGAIIAAAPKADGEKWDISYAGKVNLPPGMGGLITAKEASLSGDLWYPAIARNACTYTCKAKVPAGWTAISQGKLLSKEGDTWSFKQDLPNSYFAVSAAAYKSAEKVIGGIKFRTLSLNMTQEQMEWQNELASDVIHFYSKAFKQYPFDTWTSLVSTCMFGGALEAYSHATYMEGWLPDQDAHEPAHTWFGGIAPNTYLKSLWNESFADFCEHFFLREGSRCNREEARKAFVAPTFVNSSYNQIANTEGHCATGFLGTSVGYQRGGLALQAIESFIGTEKMTEAIKLFLNRVQPGDNPEWDDFRKALVDVNGEKAGMYFDEWLARPGYPQFKLANVAYDGKYVRGSAAFDKVEYHFPVEVLVRYTDGTETTEKVMLNGTGPFALSVKKAPALVSFDPWGKVMGTSAYIYRGVTGVSRGWARWAEPAVKGQDQAILGSGRNYSAAEPKDAAGMIIFAHPKRNALARKLAAEVGIKVEGDTATYKGTSVNLAKGGFAAVVDLPEGKKAVVAYGNVKLGPNLNTVKLALFDDLGRTLRAQMEPRTTGSFAFPLK